MNITKLEANQPIIFDGMPMTVEKIDETNGLFHVVNSQGRMWIKERTEFMRMFADGEIKLMQQNNVVGEEESTRRTLPGTTEGESEMAYLRLGYIKSCLDEDGRWITNTKERNILQHEHMLASNHDDRLSDRQIRRLYEKWNANGRMLYALVPNNRKKGNRTSRMGSEQDQFIDDVVIPLYMVREQPTISGVHVIAMAMLEQKKYAHIKPFSRATLERRILNLSEYDKCVKREGWLAAQRKFPHGSMVVKPEYMMQLAELDHTPIDVEVVDEDGVVLGRVWLTLIIETVTRMILGYHLSFNAPNAHSVIYAVKHAALSKDEIIENDPDLKDYEWPCYGLFCELSIDNGKDLHANMVRAAIFSINSCGDYAGDI